MVFVADIVGLPFSIGCGLPSGGTFGVWVPRRADDAELFVFGCPSRFASADEHNWEALQHRTPYDLA